MTEEVDAIFSNAVFHWIGDQEKLLKNISKSLKDNGQLVCEFGGKGCAETIHLALQNEFERRNLIYPRVFYFPTISEYAPIVEKSGLKVVYATLFDRITE